MPIVQIASQYKIYLSQSSRANDRTLNVDDSGPPVLPRFSTLRRMNRMSPSSSLDILSTLVKASSSAKEMVVSPTKEGGSIPYPSSSPSCSESLLSISGSTLSPSRSRLLRENSIVFLRNRRRSFLRCLLTRAETDPSRLREMLS